MTATDGSRFYLIDETTAEYPRESTAPIGFDEALARAEALQQSGHKVQVLYTEAATPEEIESFTNRGILAELASTA